MNLFHTLYDARPADSIVLRMLDGASLDTAQAKAEVGRLAAALGTLGVGIGDRVSFKLEKSPEAMFLAHACLQAGAVLHPLNTAYTDQEIGALLADAEPALFVCEPAEQERFRQLAASIGARLETLAANGQGSLAKLARQSAPQERVAEVGEDATAAILYTSGTTGRPKGAQITHGNLAASARALAQVWRLGPADVLLHALPVYHAHGLLTAINTMLACGGTLLFLPRFEAREVIAAMRDATVMMGVPTHYARLLREPDLASAPGPDFRLFISGSAPLPLELAARFRETTGFHIIERYGSTEAAIVTAVPAGVGDRTGWVGWPLPGVELRLAPDGGELLDGPGTGGLQTRGHNVFRGYWRRPDADLEAFTSDGWFITGDIAEIDAHGCVRLLGRSKDLVISGGLNVYPREVEAVLDTLPAVAESAVFGVPHPDFGEAVVAAVEIKPGMQWEEAQALVHLKQQLAPFKLPKRIVAVEEIPRNRMGKVLKATLRETYQDLFATRPG